MTKRTTKLTLRRRQKIESRLRRLRSDDAVDRAFVAAEAAALLRSYGLRRYGSWTLQRLDALADTQLIRWDDWLVSRSWEDPQQRSGSDESAQRWMVLTTPSQQVWLVLQFEMRSTITTADGLPLDGTLTMTCLRSEIFTETGDLIVHRHPPQVGLRQRTVTHPCPPGCSPKLLLLSEQDVTRRVAAATSDTEIWEILVALWHSKIGYAKPSWAYNSSP